MSKQTDSDTKTTRMYVDDLYRFHQIQDKFGCKSSAELIRKLMDISDTIETSPRTEDENSIALNMSYFVAWPTPKHLPLKKIIFPGDVRCYPSSMYHIPLTQAVWATLQKEFFGNHELNIYQEDDIYDFWHVLNLYYNQKVDRYLVYEGLRIQLKDECRYEYSDYGCPNLLLNVWRCDFVDDYADLFSKFSHYAHAENLNAISTVLAKNIDEDYDQMNYFFPLRQQ